ncbi:MAG: HEAT repeat domain-containing protein, partial [Chloroflexota bacterium]
ICSYTFALPRLNDQLFRRGRRFSRSINPAVALATLKDSRATEPLIACLSDDNGAVWVSAAETLGQIGDVRAVEPLIICLSDDNSWVRINVARALDKIGWRPQNEDRELLYMIASKSWDKLVGKGGVAVEPLIARLNDSDHYVRESTIQALGKIGDVRAVESLIACLSDKHSGVRRNAAKALGKIGDVLAVKPLIMLLDDESLTKPLNNKRVCDFAYEALQQIATPDALQACEAWVKAGNMPRSVRI